MPILYTAMKKALKIHWKRKKFLYQDFFPHQKLSLVVQIIQLFKFACKTSKFYMNENSFNKVTYNRKEKNRSKIKNYGPIVKFTLFIKTFSIAVFLRQL